MSKVYKCNCKQCGNYYEGWGEYFCSNHCRVTWTNLNRNVAKREDVRKKISESRKGKPTTLGRVLPESQRIKISQTLQGRKISKEHRDNISKGLRKGRPAEYKKRDQLKLFNGHIARKFSASHKQNLSNALKGENAPHWKGGITPINKVLRNSKEYHEWRDKVFKRDNYTCKECGCHNGNGKTIYLEAHHIKSFAHFPELRFEVNNGITLCKKCHDKTKGRNGIIKAT